MYIIALWLFICVVCTSCIDKLEETFTPVVYKLAMNADTHLEEDSEYIVVIGDIQEYTAGKGYDVYYGSTLNWILSQYMLGANIKCILQVGDITNNNTKEQYNVFYRYTLPIAQYIPYVACIGNHDYTWNSQAKINGRRQTLFSDYTSFESIDSLVVARFESGRMENIVVKNHIAGKPYYILSLEFGPRTEVLEWADEYVKRNKNCRFILMTHEFLSHKMERIADNSTAELQFQNTSWSTPEQVWQDLVKENDNIVCVLCGHNGFSAHIYSENSVGRLVPQILFNLQYQPNGGDGLIQLWQFPHNSDTVYINTYSTILQQWYADDEAYKFKFKYKY